MTACQATLEPFNDHLVVEKQAPEKADWWTLAVGYIASQIS